MPGGGSLQDVVTLDVLAIVEEARDGDGNAFRVQYGFGDLWRVGSMCEGGTYAPEHVEL